MSSFIRNKLQDLILVGSPRVAFHPAIPYHRQSLHPLIKEHAQYVSYDNAIVNGLIICKICRQIFTHARWNKRFILKHFQQIHHLPSSEDPPSLPIPGTILDKAQPNETKEALRKLEKAQANITPDPIEPNSAKVAESIEASDPVPYEVIVIDDDISASLQAKIHDSIPPIKKKRGRKAKVTSDGAPAPAKKKREKKGNESAQDVLSKTRATKKKVLKNNQPACDECTCSTYLT